MTFPFPVTIICKLEVFEDIDVVNWDSIIKSSRNEESELVDIVGKSSVASYATTVSKLLYVAPYVSSS